MSKNLLMIVFHCYRVYINFHEHYRNKIFASYENLVDTPLSSCNYDQPLYSSNRTIRRPLIKTPRRYFSSISSSIAYPFARRRNDGGRARTAFALYGLPFRSPQMPQSTTVSSCSSLVAKAFAH